MERLRIELGREPRNIFLGDRNSPVLKRIPNARSSNHSIIFPRLRAQFDQARSFEQPQATGKRDFPQPGKTT